MRTSMLELYVDTKVFLRFSLLHQINHMIEVTPLW